jgi:hypothetical protein
MNVNSIKIEPLCCMFCFESYNPKMLMTHGIFFPLFMNKLRGKRERIIARNFHVFIAGRTALHS